MSGKNPSPDPLSILDALASSGSLWLRKSRLREGLRANLPKGLALLLLVPAVAIAVTALGWLLGQPWKLPPVWMAVLCPLPPLLYLGYHGIQLLGKQPLRRESLAVFDEALDLRDRLQTADEFLTVANPSPFMAAAIEDAAPAMERASHHHLAWDWGKPWVELRRLAVLPMLALLLILLGIFLPSASPTASPTLPPGGTPVATDGTLPLPLAKNPTDQAQKTVKVPDPKEEKQNSLVRIGAQGEPAKAKAYENPSNEPAGRDKVSPGASEGGQTSQASSSGRASQSSGMPGSQAPSSSPQKQPESPKKETKPKKTDVAEAPRKKTEDQSGANAGRGGSGGSSRNPASTEWASKDQTETADNEAPEQEEDVTDEDSESEARGGLQPNLRDRRPPVNRDLSVGFGNKSSPDSNGRSGPGERKKSRGVAGLVLGVPVPDQVKGQPNPGRVKVTQERVQPQGEAVPGEPAEDRGRRTSPPGHLSERTLDASMREIVRAYFLQTNGSQTEPSTK